MAAFAPLKVLGKNEYVLINPSQVVAIELAGDGKTSRVCVGVTAKGVQNFYDIEHPPKEVWIKLNS
ncbi:hypothetical protein ACVMB3_003335 [Sinorhizobium meliloti]|uniref:hypothetical protein n=1 Tax=Sinorhizobium TaxID=28105 RepID=UPI000FDA7EEF|nr:MULTISPECIES: hypothetical protein [Sinorhizobium]MCM5691597.1 hypothetical protein [Sinorhizobium meliloti]MDE3824007.1 hypothetical protein [Sinorhizobium meliloti]MDW9770388.1 hypothetical protein [Sinorhizobium meliloti]MDW9844787.1 hypothetical protein [Sinorhizobium meliloti]MDX0141871.1 hypothetical protein [Sinorhizobium meliloti]